MEGPFHFLEEPPKDRGLSVGAIASFALHAAVVAALLLLYKEPQKLVQAPLRYVELMAMPQQAAERQFVEAPGPKLDVPPSPDAAWSDANRRASMPKPTGDRPTSRPGIDGAYIPGSPAPRQQAAMPQQPPSPPANASGGGDKGSGNQQIPNFAYRVPTGDDTNASRGSSQVDWRNAIREVGKVASLGGDGGFPGGEEGYAESGPISFETQWYDWGEYAQHMVARIRTHWYANMPPLIRMGVRGVVTIRFTIQRDGRITDIEMVKSSGHPPYDFAARKAIELSSSLRPLPADFPNASERVTAMFYYNMRPDRR